ncbi:MAG TPA: TetR/AcrR family transcriptional regulator [Acidimicrobiales bacterium]|nr:TetR/AcrR family transcriptional regulator [Acidimicrobiales bacterium]
MAASPSTTSRRHRAPRGHGEALRGEILAAARELLAETGDEGAVSVRAVAQRVGVTTPSIYLHFKDKEDLLDAVCADVFESLAAALEEATASETAPLERLAAQGRAYIRFALAKPEHYRLAFMVSGGHRVVDDVLSDRCLGQVLQTISECMAAGIFPPDPRGPLPAGLQLWAAVHGVASLLLTKPWLPWGEVDEVIEQALRTAIAGYLVAARNPGAPFSELSR